MKTLFHFRRAHAFAPLLALGLLSACGGGGDSVKPVTATADVTTSVPTAASAEAAAATSYVSSLSTQPEATTNSLEPVPVPDKLATDDTAEPT
jgi:hypothetical protein